MSLVPGPNVSLVPGPNGATIGWGAGIGGVASCLPWYQGPWVVLLCSENRVIAIVLVATTLLGLAGCLLRRSINERLRAFAVT